MTKILCFVVLCILDNIITLGNLYTVSVDYRNNFFRHIAYYSFKEQMRYYIEFRSLERRIVK